MKKHRVVPLETMEIDFIDKTLLFRFDMQAIAKLQDTYGSLEEVANSTNQFDMSAMILWAGIKDDDVTLDEAKVIISSSAEVLADTLSITMDSILKLGGEENEKKLQEEIAKAMKKLNA